MKVSADYVDRIRLYVLEHGKITNRECRKLLDISYNESIRVLHNLCDLGMLERVGVGSGTKYIFSSTYESVQDLGSDEQFKGD